MKQKLFKDFLPCLNHFAPLLFFTEMAKTVNITVPCHLLFTNDQHKTLGIFCYILPTCFYMVTLFWPHSRVYIPLFRFPQSLLPIH